MLRELSFIGVVFGGVVVMVGLYQAFATVDPMTGIDLVRVYAWSMVTLAGMFFTGYVALKYVFAQTSRSRRPHDPKNYPNISSHYSRTRGGRR